jgi:2-keto-3-deoxy-L-rhamnonate aldolase RhmA
MFAESLIAKLDAGEVPIGMVIHITDPTLVEIAALAGYDWVSFTLEHFDHTGPELQAIQRAADSHSIPVLLHVPDPRDPRIVPALGSGVGGVVLSRGSSHEEVEALVDTVRFPPLGSRGVHSGMRADGYGAHDFATFVAEVDRSIAVGIAIEDKEGVEDADRILGTPGITMAFIGMMDLSHSLGIPGQYDDPVLLAAIREVVSVARRHGVPIGLPHYHHSLAALRAMGADLIMTPGVDQAFIFRAFKAHLDQARAEIAAADGAAA